MTAHVLAVALAALAGLVLPGDPSAGLRRVQRRPVLAGRGAGAAVGALAPSERQQVRRTGRRIGSMRPEGLGALVAAGVGLGARSPVLGAAAGVAVWAGYRAVVRRRVRLTASHARLLVLELLTTLAAELRTGAQPRDALAAAADDCASEGASRTSADWCAVVAAAARSPTGDPATALGIAASGEGCSSLRDLSAAWRVVERTGGGLAAAVGRLATAARAEDAVYRELDGALAGPRATAGLLAVLPFGGVLMGRGLGGDPVGFLLGPGAGQLCLLAGVSLVALGAWWTDAIVDRAAR